MRNNARKVAEPEKREERRVIGGGERRLGADGHLAAYRQDPGQLRGTGISQRIRGEIDVFNMETSSKIGNN